MNHRSFLTFCMLVYGLSGISAQVIPPPTAAEVRLAGFAQRAALDASSWCRGIPFTSIGPSIFSGRVVDVEVNPRQPSEMYVAYASGGLWHTVNNGTTMTPVFDQEAAMTIGDIAVNWAKGTIWVGTGENNASRSSYAGVGIYKSADRGATWQHMGLAESHHIGRILLHPANPNVVHVACLGALYSESPHRGVYSTSDGGKSWRKSLYAGPDAGAIDLVADPVNPNTLYAATWERTRRYWNFTEAGPGTAIYKSTDSGRTWDLMTDAGSGFPSGEHAGRIGLDIVRTRSGSLLYAVIDNQTPRPAELKDPEILTKSEVERMQAEAFLALDDERIRRFLKDHGFPEHYTVDSVRTLLRQAVITPKSLVEYLYDANSQLFETEVTGPEVYRSEDGGRSWQKTHDGYLDNVFYTYGYYFGQIRVSPRDPDKLYLLGVPILKSEDGGATWASIGGDNVHADHHALWINPAQDGHLVLGNDGGLNLSYDDGAHWIKCNQPAVGQFYSVAIDMATPYNVYGGLQDNGVWYGPSTYSYSTRWHDRGRYPYQFISGGDGMQVAVDPRNHQTVYSGLQFGHYYRFDMRTGERTYITPRHALGERPYRWNWESPIHLSIHHPDIFYLGAERVFRSFDRGEHAKAISGDLTDGGKPGNVSSGTLVSLHESPLRFGLLYTGSDDGLVHMSPDGGLTWVNITAGLPSHLWVSSLQAGSHVESRVYIALNGYRWDHFDSYVYRSDDYGKTWQRIAIGLPAEPVNVVREDPVNPDLLYIGTDHGLYVSLDGGHSVMTIGDMPHAPVHDLVVHPRDRELVVATHGRSLYKAPVKHLQLIQSAWTDTLTCFDESVSITYRASWGMQPSAWQPAVEPSLSLPVFSSQGGDIRLDILAGQEVLAGTHHTIPKGLSYVPIDFAIDSASAGRLDIYLQQQNPSAPADFKAADNGKFYLRPGKYQVIIHQGARSDQTMLEIKDPKAGNR